MLLAGAAVSLCDHCSVYCPMAIFATMYRAITRPRTIPIRTRFTGLPSFPGGVRFCHRPRPCSKLYHGKLRRPPRQTPKVAGGNKSAQFGPRDRASQTSERTGCRMQETGGGDVCASAQESELPDGQCCTLLEDVPLHEQPGTYIRMSYTTLSVRGQEHIGPIKGTAGSASITWGSFSREYFLQHGSNLQRLFESADDAVALRDAEMDTAIQDDNGLYCASKHSERFADESSKSERAQFCRPLKFRRLMGRPSCQVVSAVAQKPVTKQP